MRCVNRAVGADWGTGVLPPCRRCYHAGCFKGTPGVYGESQLAPKKYAGGGLEIREADLRVLDGRWVCDMCVVVSTIGSTLEHDVPRLVRLCSLERDRQLRALAACTDSTRMGHVTGLNKIQDFEREFGVDVLPRAPVGLILGQEEVKVQWCFLLSAQKLVSRGRGPDRETRHIKFTGLESIRSAMGAARGAVAMYDTSIPAAGTSKGGRADGTGAGSEARRAFTKGLHLFMGRDVVRPEVLPTAVLVDIQALTALEYREATAAGDHHRAMEMAVLCWYVGIMGLAGYRPGDLLHTSREQWSNAAVEVEGEAGFKIVLDARDLKGAHATSDHVVHVPSVSKSLMVGAPGRWVMRGSLLLGAAPKAPMVSVLSPGFDSSTLLVTLLRPALAAIRDGDLPSSARVKDMDLSLVNVRSFRRSATQAMRKAGVDPELVEYIQQWKHRGNSSDMRMHYDSVDAADTMGAMRGV